MLPKIKFLPLGPIKMVAVLQEIAINIEKTYRLPCEICDPLPIPELAYDPARDQYNSKIILESLNLESQEPIKILAITEVDLFIPIMKYVFGLSIIGGRSAVISLYRMYADGASNGILIQRAIKTAIHELAHTFGMKHCKVKRCVMFPSVSVKDTDEKDSDFCINCSNILDWLIKKFRLSEI